jgi:hypothetical protein
MEFMKALQEKLYDLRLNDVEPTKLCIGAKIGEFTIPGGNIKTWYLSTELYLNKAISVIEEHFGKLVNCFTNIKLWTPALCDFHPEIDTSALLKDDEITLYQNYVGILRCAIELGRIDVANAGPTMT